VPRKSDAKGSPDEHGDGFDLENVAQGEATSGFDKLIVD
jgi:hypothetical protein